MRLASRADAHPRRGTRTDVRVGVLDTGSA
jgi:hypothetical protein